MSNEHKDIIIIVGVILFIVLSIVIVFTGTALVTYKETVECRLKAITIPMPVTEAILICSIK